MIRTAKEYQQFTKDSRKTVHRIGLVPTMGAFHEGHHSLMRRAAGERDTVIASVFVNPLQFGANEDFERYPRDEASDIHDAEANGVDLLFLPTLEEVFPDYPPPVTLDAGPVGETFEGAARPGHFSGMLTIVNRLFQLTGECRAYFGEKDAQQLFLVRKMAAEMAPNVAIVGCPTVREPDGLAMSSRNTYLTSEERQAADCLYQGLFDAHQLVKDSGTDAKPVLAALAAPIEAEPLATLDYAAIVDGNTFEETSVLQPESSALALVAAVIGTTRLIDNMALIR